jgi:cyclase
VSLNTAAVRKPQLITEAARCFGSSTIVLSIEAKRRPDGSYEAYTDNGRERTHIDAIEWARRGESLGAGEILLTSIDREGTGQGYDLELTRAVATQLSIPVIACGGAGSAEHVREVIETGRADAVSLASVLHYHLAGRHGRATHQGPPLATFAGAARPGSSALAPASIQSIKRQLGAAGIDCRPQDSEAA